MVSVNSASANAGPLMRNQAPAVNAVPATTATASSPTRRPSGSGRSSSQSAPTGSSRPACVAQCCEGREPHEEVDDREAAREDPQHGQPFSRRGGEQPRPLGRRRWSRRSCRHRAACVDRSIQDLVIPGRAGHEVEPFLHDLDGHRARRRPPRDLAAQGLGASRPDGLSQELS